jgi:hypothetical protein
LYNYLVTSNAINIRPIAETKLPNPLGKKSLKFDAQ